MRTSAFSLWLLLSCLVVTCQADVTFDLSTARLTLDARGAVAAFTFNDGTRWPASGQPAMVIEGGGKTWAVRSITRAGDALQVPGTPYVILDANCRCRSGSGGSGDTIRNSRRQL